MAIKKEFVFVRSQLEAHSVVLLHTCHPQLVEKECAFMLVACFSPHQARWYPLGFLTTNKLKIMNNPLSNLKLDAWFKVVIVICTLVFLLTAGGQLPNLPTNSALLISIGGVLFCCGEWKNHIRYSTLEERFLGEGYKRIFNLLGIILCLIGFYLICKGIMLLL